MYSICIDFVQDGELEQYYRDLREIEKKFTQEIGVLEREFFQCIVQPHIIWAYTKWTEEKAHNDAFESMIKVRRDDRIYAAYKSYPYFEIFCREMEGAVYKASGNRPFELVVVCHGLVSIKKQEQWNENIRVGTLGLSSIEGLSFSRTFYNYYNPTEFVGFMGWSNQRDYWEYRTIEDLTIEEHLYTGLKSGKSFLAAYNQFRCKPFTVL
jgi:hypothetical protein